MSEQPQKQSLSAKDVEALLTAHGERQQRTGRGLSEESLSMTRDILQLGGNVVLNIASGINAVDLRATEINSLIVALDVSWSMVDQKPYLVTNTNRLLDDLSGRTSNLPPKLVNSFEITIVTFNGNGVKVLRANEPVISCAPITADELEMKGSTPLYKTVISVMAGGVSRSEDLRNPSIPMPSRKTNRVIFVVITDDGDNHPYESMPDGRVVEYKASAVNRMARELLATERWTLAIGVASSESDVDPIADKLGFPARRHISRTDDGWAEFFDLVSKNSIQASMRQQSGGNTFLSGTFAP